MAEYAYLVCRANETMFALGKAVKKPNGDVDYFHRVDPTVPSNSGNTLLSKALWKFVAEYGPRGLVVVSEYDDDFEAIAEYREVGGDEIGDISLEQYVAGWPG
ncbi:MULTISPECIES: hypothetical protein [Nocardia]|uniref:hypothetical protein n=1 Tax=Nocardia TaxID=1817 RepID=UPI0007EBBF18|nr:MULTISPECIES: hypothetical protein [Nocardia]MBF6278312.1 hypothetical protein [Nocardia nova]OBA46528.1 hypothetical protein A5789_04090 [Nocardia sp. 852002-51101_SCH5132738]OBB55015.1 hypothetical protein A5748_10990 [Nocardia sp. 852002-51244_SCH5132740]OBF72692.1 hypothetical protein A9X06_27905 [Mycobacterium sp. 852002-51759_SCH5129042]